MGSPLSPVKANIYEVLWENVSKNNMASLDMYMPPKYEGVTRKM